VNESFEIVRAPSSGGRGSGAKRGSSDPAESDSRGVIRSLFSGYRNRRSLFSSVHADNNRSMAVDHKASVEPDQQNLVDRSGAVVLGKPRLRVSSVGLIEGEGKGDEGNQTPSVQTTVRKQSVENNRMEPAVMDVLEMSAHRSGEV